MSYVRSTWSTGIGAVAAGDINITVKPSSGKKTTIKKPSGPSWLRSGGITIRKTTAAPAKPIGRGPLFVTPAQVVSRAPMKVLRPGTPTAPVTPRPGLDVSAPSGGGSGGGTVPSGGGGGGGGGGGTPMPTEPIPMPAPELPTELDELEQLEPVDPEVPIEETSAIVEKKPMSTAVKVGLGVGAGLLLLSMFSK